MEPAEKTYVAYFRVSTTQQGQSGLGLDAQKQAVLDFIGSDRSTILEIFIEVESGKRNSRPELEKALALCKRKKATLIIAKLDRLARNVHFISGLMESKVDFVAVDNPHANRLMIHLLAAFAEHEREQISIRTKAALAAARAKGTQLGINGSILARQNREAANEFATMIRSKIEELPDSSKQSLRVIADSLNAKGVTTYRKGRWHPATVARILNRNSAPSLQGRL